MRLLFILSGKFAYYSKYTKAEDNVKYNVKD